MPKSFLIRRKREHCEDEGPFSELQTADSLTIVGNCYDNNIHPLDEEKEVHTPPNLKTDLNNNISKTSTVFQSKITNNADATCDTNSMHNGGSCDSKIERHCKYTFLNKCGMKGGQMPAYENGEKDELTEFKLNGLVVKHQADYDHLEKDHSYKMEECLRIDKQNSYKLPRTTFLGVGQCNCFSCFPEYQKGRTCSRMQHFPQSNVKYRTTCNYGCCDTNQVSTYENEQIWTRDFSHTVDKCKDCFERAYRSIAYRTNERFRWNNKCCTRKCCVVQENDRVSCKISKLEHSDVQSNGRDHDGDKMNSNFLADLVKCPSPTPFHNVDTEKKTTESKGIFEENSDNFKIHLSENPEQKNFSESFEHRSCHSEDSLEQCDITEEEFLTQEKQTYPVNYSPEETRLQVLRSQMGRGKRQRCGRRGGRIKNNRLLANEHERRRVAELNSGFQELRKVLPGYSDDTKLTKIKILRYAILYIAHLAKVLDEGYLGPLVLS